MTSSSLVYGFPDSAAPLATSAESPDPDEDVDPATIMGSSSSPVATLPSNQLAFENCNWMADCNHMSGKIPIPCPDNYCDRFLLCIDNRPTMQQCDPSTSWLFWSTKTNFNPLSLQCEKDFKTCDWYKTVRLSAGTEGKSEEDSAEAATKAGIDTTPIEAAADSAKDDLLGEIRKQANSLIVQLANNTAAIVKMIKMKTEKISEDVQEDTLALLQKLKDDPVATNSTQMAMGLMKAIITQIKTSSDQVKEGIELIVDNMRDKISGVLAIFHENAAHEIDYARDNLNKVLPKPIDTVEEVHPVAERANGDEPQTKADKSVEEVKEKQIDKNELEAKKVNETMKVSEEMMQGDMPAQGEAPTDEKKIEETQEKKEKLENKQDGRIRQSTGSATTESATYFVYLSAILTVVIAQFL